jgi:hypothetical protein
LLEGMVVHGGVCLRRIAKGHRAAIVRYGRFLANAKVTVEGLVASWGEQTAAGVAGRHVLAIQDTSEINFRTTPDRQRGLGEIGKGVGRGILVHAMLALDAADESCLGLVAGEIWTRHGRVAAPHKKRPLSDKESRRWVTTAECAKTVLAAAETVTVIADRESDFYEEWASVPGPGFHLLTRVMQDRHLADGSSLYAVGEALANAGTAMIDLRARGSALARRAKLTLRFGRVTLRRSQGAAPGLPASVTLSLVEVVERRPPADTEPLHWRLLTTHDVGDATSAWRVVDWYKMRWNIEQLFRVLKKQGLRIEDSQLDSADRLLKLAAIAVKAAAITLQLTQARDGRNSEPASLVFADDEMAALAALDAEYKGKTTLQINPHRRRSLAWPAWIIARLGGWDGYPSSRPPGPITLKHGLDYFHAIAKVVSEEW